MGKGDFVNYWNDVSKTVHGIAREKGFWDNRKGKYSIG
jgi:hypothetical protein